uniref:Ras-related protein Rab-18 n=1 Tax=Arcella intermedia TaxID=1963864 RepID=A0A6B2LIG9_9EUKA
MLLGQWIDDKVTETSATINVEFASKSFRVEGKVVKVQLWDTAGQEQYRSVTRTYYRKAHGALLVYDVSNNDSFSRLEGWLKDVKEAPGNENTQILLIGNKSDKEDQREVSTERGIEFSRLNNINFMETSAKTGDNVDRAFQIILQDIHKLTEKFVKLESRRTKSSVQGRATVKLTTDSPAEETCCPF